MKEIRKIVKFGDDGSKIVSEKLNEIAGQLYASNRRAVQFCIAEVYGIETIAKPPRFFLETHSPEVLFVPITPEQKVAIEAYLDEHKTTFKEMVVSAINAIYGNLTNLGQRLDVGPNYRKYVGDFKLNN